MKKKHDRYRPLLDIPSIKPSVHFWRDRLDSKSYELVFKSPFSTFEMVPPFIFLSNALLLTSIALNRMKIGKTVPELRKKFIRRRLFSKIGDES